MWTESFGAGLDAKVKEAYKFLVENYEEGDEIFLFGFSRGAFAARAIGSFICNVSPQLCVLSLYFLLIVHLRRLVCSRKTACRTLIRYTRNIATAGTQN